MIFQLLDGNIPPLYGVASRAVRSHLPLVNIGVAVLAILSRIGEYGLDVALHALHLFVHTTKGILCIVVTKLQNGPDGFPACSGVAVFARNSKDPMRTSSVLPLGRRIRST